MNKIPDKLLITKDFTGHFSDGTILNWIERHLLSLSLSISGKYEITYTENGRAKSVIGDSVRHAVAGLLHLRGKGEDIPEIAGQMEWVSSVTAVTMAKASDPTHRKRWLKMMAERNWRIERDDAGEVTALQHRPTGTRIEGTAVTRWLVLDAEPPTGDTWEDAVAFAMETYRPLWEKLAALDADESDETLPDQYTSVPATEGIPLEIRRADGKPMQIIPTTNFCTACNEGAEDGHTCGSV